MKVYYDPKHDACAVEFDKDDCLIFSVHRGKLNIDSCNGGKPEVTEKQLRFEMKGERG